MTQSEYGGAPRVVTDIATRVLADPQTRRAFADDPTGTLQRAGIDPEAVPGRLLETLTSLSFDELGVVARMNESLVDVGFTSESGALCFIF
jgi:hypothetical protein